MARQRTGNSNSPPDSVIATRQAEMAAFDRLPPAIREALTRTRVQWSAISIEELMHSKNISAEMMLRRLLEVDAQQ